MKCELNNEQIRQLVNHQLRNFWYMDSAVLGLEKQAHIDDSLKRMEKNLSQSGSKYCRDETGVIFSIENTVQYSIFLYYLSNSLYRAGYEQQAAFVYYLNKIMHSVDWFYAVELPDIFMAEHPAGSILGRAKYSNRFFIYQGCTVGGAMRDHNTLYPKISENVVMTSNSKILGDSKIGKNVIIAADAVVKNEEVPDNCIVFGSSPDLIIKIRGEEVMTEKIHQICDWRTV